MEVDSVLFYAQKYGVAPEEMDMFLDNIFDLSPDNIITERDVDNYMRYRLNIIPVEEEKKLEEGRILQEKLKKLEKSIQQQTIEYKRRVANKEYDKTNIIDRVLYSNDFINEPAKDNTAQAKIYSDIFGLNATTTPPPTPPAPKPPSLNANVGFQSGTVGGGAITSGGATVVSGGSSGGTTSTGTGHTSGGGGGGGGGSSTTNYNQTIANALAYGTSARPETPQVVRLITPGGSISTTATPSQLEQFRQEGLMERYGTLTPQHSGSSTSNILTQSMPMLSPPSVTSSNVLQTTKTPVGLTGTVFDTSKPTYGGLGRSQDEIKALQSIGTTSTGLTGTVFDTTAPLFGGLGITPTPKTSSLAGTVFDTSKPTYGGLGRSQDEIKTLQDTAVTNLLKTTPFDTTKGLFGGLGRTPDDIKRSTNELAGITIPELSHGVQKFSDIFTIGGIKEGARAFGETFYPDKEQNILRKKLDEAAKIELGKILNTNVTDINQALNTYQQQIGLLSSDATTKLSEFEKEQKALKNYLDNTFETQIIDGEKKYIIPNEIYDIETKKISDWQNKILNINKQIFEDSKQIDKKQVDVNNLIYEYNKKVEQIGQLDKLNVISEYYKGKFEEKPNILDWGTLRLVGGAKAARDTGQFLFAAPEREFQKDIASGNTAQVILDKMIPGYAMYKGIYNPLRKEEGISKQALSGGINTAVMAATFGYGALAKPAASTVTPTLSKMIGKTTLGATIGGGINLGMSSVPEVLPVITGKETIGRALANIGESSGYLSTVGAGAKLTGFAGGALKSQEISKAVDKELKNFKIAQDGKGRIYGEVDGKILQPRFEAPVKGGIATGEQAQKVASFDLPILNGKYTLRVEGNLGTTNILGQAKGVLQRAPLASSGWQSTSYQLLDKAGKPLGRVLSTGLSESRSVGYAQKLSDESLFAGKTGQTYTSQPYQGDWTTAIRGAKIGKYYPFKDFGVKYTQTPFQEGTLIKPLSKIGGKEASTFESVSYYGKPSKISGKEFRTMEGTQLTLPSNLRGIKTQLTKPVDYLGTSNINILKQQGTMVKAQPVTKYIETNVMTGARTYEDPSVLYQLTGQYGKVLPTDTSKLPIDELMGRIYGSRVFTEVTPGQTTNVIKEIGPSPFITKSTTVTSQGKLLDTRPGLMENFNRFLSENKMLASKRAIGYGTPTMSYIPQISQTTYQGKTVLPGETGVSKMMSQSDLMMATKLPSGVSLPQMAMPGLISTGGLLSTTIGKGALISVPKTAKETTQIPGLTNVKLPSTIPLSYTMSLPEVGTVEIPKTEILPKTETTQIPSQIPGIDTTQITETPTTFVGLPGTTIPPFAPGILKGGMFAGGLGGLGMGGGIGRGQRGINEFLVYNPIRNLGGEFFATKLDNPNVDKYSVSKKRNNFTMPKTKPFNMNRLIHTKQSKKKNSWM